MIDLVIGADGIARVRFDDPDEKVNLLTEAALARLEEILDRLESGGRERTLRGVVLASAKEKKILSEVNMGAAVYSTPIVANGLMYVGSQTHLDPRELAVTHSLAKVIALAYLGAERQRPDADGDAA